MRLLVQLLDPTSLLTHLLVLPWDRSVHEERPHARHVSGIEPHLALGAREAVDANLHRQLHQIARPLGLLDQHAGVVALAVLGMHEVPAFQQILVVAVPVSDDQHPQCRHHATAFINHPDEPALASGGHLDAIPHLGVVDAEHPILAVQHQQQRKDLVLVRWGREPHTGHACLGMIERLHLLGPGSVFWKACTCLRTPSMLLHMISVPTLGSPPPGAVMISGPTSIPPPAVMMGVVSSPSSIGGPL